MQFTCNDYDGGTVYVRESHKTEIRNLYRIIEKIFTYMNHYVKLSRHKIKHNLERITFNNKNTDTNNRGMHNNNRQQGIIIIYKNGRK